MQDNIKSEIWRIIIFPAVLCGWETWSLTLREGHCLRVLESRVLRVIFGGKREEVTRVWRKLQSEGLYDWYCLPGSVRVIMRRRDGQCMWHVWARMKCIQGFGRENWKRAVARPRHQWKYTVKIELKRVWIRGSGLGWTDWGQEWVVGCWEYGNEPSGVIKYGECLDWLRNCQLLKKSCSSCISVGLSVRSAGHLQFLMVIELCGSVTDKLRVMQVVTNFPTST
jgi:hypothetical protein